MPELSGVSTPARDRIFGRESDIERVRNAIRGDAASKGRVAVTGVPGIGKHSVASAVVSDLAEDYDMCVHVSCESYSAHALTTSDIAGRLVARLTGEHSVGPHAVESLQAILAGNRALIALTGVRSAAQVTGLGLPDSCDVLLTSESKLTALSGYQRYGLTPISPEAAAELLAHYGDGVGPFGALASSCMYHPALLRMCASVLASNDSTSPDELAQTIKDSILEIDSLGFGASVASAMQAIHDSLTQPARLLLAMLAGVPFPSVATEDMKALMFDERISAIHLAQLCEWNLVEVVDSDGMSLVVVARFARATLHGHLGETPRDCADGAISLSKRIVDRASGTLERLSSRAIREALGEGGPDLGIRLIGNSEADLRREWPNLVIAARLLALPSGSGAVDTATQTKVRETLRSLGYWQLRGGQIKSLISTASLLGACGGGHYSAFYRHTAAFFVGVALREVGLASESAFRLAVEFDQMNQDFSEFKSAHSDGRLADLEDAHEVPLLILLIERTLLELGRAVSDLSASELAELAEISAVVARARPENASSAPELLTQMNLALLIRGPTTEDQTFGQMHLSLSEAMTSARIRGVDLPDLSELIRDSLKKAADSARSHGDVFLLLRTDLLDKMNQGQSDPAEVAGLLSAALQFGATMTAAEAAFVAAMNALVAGGSTEDEVAVFLRFLEAGQPTEPADYANGNSILSAVVGKSLWLLSEMGCHSAMIRLRDFALMLAEKEDPRFQKFAAIVEDWRTHEVVPYRALIATIAAQL